MMKQPEPVATPGPSNDDQKAASKGPKAHPRPKAISTAPGNLFGFPQEQPKNTKTAREAIYDNSGVGADLRSSRTESSVPTGFLKPAGVDDPLKTRPSSSRLDLKAKVEKTDVISGARKQKAKREHSTLDLQDGEGVKRKKTKNNTI